MSQGYVVTRDYTHFNSFEDLINHLKLSLKKLEYPCQVEKSLEVLSELERIGQELGRPSSFKFMKTFWHDSKQTHLTILVKDYGKLLTAPIVDDILRPTYMGPYRILDVE